MLPGRAAWRARAATIALVCLLSGTQGALRDHSCLRSLAGSCSSRAGLQVGTQLTWALCSLRTRRAAADASRRAVQGRAGCPGAREGAGSRRGGLAAPRPRARGRPARCPRARARAALLRAWQPCARSRRARRRGARTSPVGRRGRQPGVGPGNRRARARPSR